MTARWLLATHLACSAVWLAGCGSGIPFPPPLTDAAVAHRAFRAYDTNGDDRADFFLYTDASGRVVRLGYDRTHDGAPDSFVDLDANRPRHSRHLVIILDGVGHDLLGEYYAAGGLRVCHPPSRVIAPYPSMTDLCLSQALNYIRPLGYEARYYDHKTNRLVGGSGSYLAETNEPHLRLIQYKAHTFWRAMGFIYPGYVFGRELANAKRRFDKVETQEFIAYFGSSAGMGTRQSAAGHRAVLEGIERLVNQALWESRGLIEVTVTSDHGHTYSPGRLWPVAAHLQEKGWRLRDRLAGERDVVPIRFGLVTFASFATRSPAALAADLSACRGAEVVSYAQDRAVVVLGPEGARALIRRKDGRFAYEPSQGDPLGLNELIGGLQSDSQGYYDADELLMATADHVYPAALERLWEGHFALAQNPPDVICSLQDGYFAGSEGFAGSVSVSSTHGSLNRANSTTFIMSTIGPLPEIMRSRDIPEHMSALIGGPWPMRK